MAMTGALGAPVIEMAFHSGELGLPNLGLAVRAVIMVDLDAAFPASEMAMRRRAARIASGVARRAATAITTSEARASVERADEPGEVCTVQFAYDEMADGLARRVRATFELLLEPRDPDEAIRLRAALPTAALLVRMADAVHDAVDDPAWVSVFGAS
jgi:hypothetical protein